MSTPEDIVFMRQALSWARQAADLKEVPVGAVAVFGGQVVGVGYNRREIDKAPFAHAEMMALHEASKSLDAWRLSSVTLYVTLEPCVMCAGALVQCRLGRLVYGATDVKAGAVGSLYNLVQDARLNHRVEVEGGVLAEECSDILKSFFRSLRRKEGA